MELPIASARAQNPAGIGRSEISPVPALAGATAVAGERTAPGPGVVRVGVGRAGTDASRAVLADGPIGVAAAGLCPRPAAPRALTLAISSRLKASAE